MRGVEIRPAELADVHRAIAMYEWLFAPPGSRPAGWDADRARVALARAVEAPSAVVLLASVDGMDGVDGTLVGLCTAYEDIESVRFGRRVWVEDLAVDPARRSEGIGKALLEEAKAWARARGATHLELDSATTRADAHRFYEREQPSTRSLCFGWTL